MDLAFVAVTMLHILVWVVVLMAWVHPAAARFNLVVLIPAIYVVHVLPFHILNILKQRMHPGTWLRDVRRVERALVLPALVTRARDALDRSFANPLSPQGMLLLGAITSAWRLLLF